MSQLVIDTLIEYYWFCMTGAAIGIVGILHLWARITTKEEEEKQEEKCQPPM
jgi:hypothetical protein